MKEAVALVYGWPPCGFDSFTLDRLDQWAAFAAARLNPKKA